MRGQGSLLPPVWIVSSQPHLIIGELLEVTIAPVDRLDTSSTPQNGTALARTSEHEAAVSRPQRLSSSEPQLPVLAADAASTTTATHLWPDPVIWSNQPGQATTTCLRRSHQGMTEVRQNTQSSQGRSYSVGPLMMLALIGACCHWTRTARRCRRCTDRPTRLDTCGHDSAGRIR